VGWRVPSSWNARLPRMMLVSRCWCWRECCAVAPCRC